ncbi:RNA polymerase sigma factor SigA [Posidoniimonas corsicana]|uniref:RNA polymerase sigma factor SigA n=2 Tax=Posidoniimonas corsicana TaxID=1938618 RepID=A0A5C5VF56_9BACT|nr:RNA polymerase sigma factor SigA [Posidoniimonas corsicana]
MLMSADTSFIPNDGFSTRTKVRRCATWERLRSQLTGRSDGRKSTGPVAGLGSTELLSPAEEAELFLRMNFLKFRTSALKKRIARGEQRTELIERATVLLDEALAVRNHLITANMRLVMAVAKKYVSPVHAFDELVSEGTMTLMHAVDKFDADRGFRFSTYAYRSIARNLYRCVMDAQKEKQRVPCSVEEHAVEPVSESQGSAALDQSWQNVRRLAYSMLEGLDRREKFIIRSRYALGAHRKPRTFQYLADKLGISKERARQLEGRAVSKLKQMAESYDRDELFGAVVS